MTKKHPVEDSGERSILQVVGMSFLFLTVLGLGSAIAAFISLVQKDYSGTGLCLIASALCFGFLLHAFRN